MPYQFHVPGRIELAGNHTDHQHGLALAAAANGKACTINRQIHADAKPLEDGHIHIESEGFLPVDIVIREQEDLVPVKEEKGTTAALVRGVAAAYAKKMAEKGSDDVPHIPGFFAAIRTEVLPGSGLSSSAAFEILIGTILNSFSEAALTPLDLALIGQKAEVEFYGKPCGLLDQLTCAYGRCIAIDFCNPASPEVTEISYDFKKSGFCLCLVDCGADHAGLTKEYALVTKELADVCRIFGKSYLREVAEDTFYDHMNEVRELAGDRAMLRALHVYEENRRVSQMAEALGADDFPRYLRLVNESGASSYRYLQNIIPSGAVREQQLAVAYALAEKLLRGDGAVRPNGGGFAGTLEAYVPEERAEEFCAEMKRLLGTEVLI